MWTRLPRGLQPIVQPIDDWNRNLKLAMLFECSVGAGKLMVTSLDLSEKAASDLAHPGAGCTPAFGARVHGFGQVPAGDYHVMADLQRWVPVRYTAPATVLKPDTPASPDLVDPGQIRRKPQ